MPLHYLTVFLSLTFMFSLLIELTTMCIMIKHILILSSPPFTLRNMDPTSWSRKNKLTRRGVCCDPRIKLTGRKDYARSFYNHCWPLNCSNYCCMSSHINNNNFQISVPIYFPYPFSLSIDFLFLGTLPQIEIPVTPQFGCCSLTGRLPPRLSSYSFFVNLWMAQ